MRELLPEAIKSLLLKKMLMIPYLADGGIRDALLQIPQAITTQAQTISTQAQAIMDQANRKVVPRVGTIASHLRDFTRMNHLTFYGSKVEEYP